MSLTVSVIVPTWRRPSDLRRCLTALANQTRAADEVLVVHRAEDAETVRVLEEAPAGLLIRGVVVVTAGQVAALNRGLDQARGQVIAITDDDAVPRADWLLRIVLAFEGDPTLTGMGGRDWLHVDGRPETGERREVGRVQGWGRCIGNHHLGAGGPREVDILKGANMSFRRAHLGDLRFDARMRGEGAQVCNDMAFCLALRRAGRRLVYDPAVAVDHFPGVRHDADQRRGFSAEAQANRAHNETLALLAFLPRGRRAVFLVWALLLGTRANPGLLQGLRWTLWAGPRQAAARVRATVAGRVAGWRTWRASSREAA
ncbi:glycosyltransferase family 2 protein [Brevundimonas sp. PAMC22021]|uniref:glycosyltransferase family 2 protein n=1 Tax=Brevundimonas sp. PAMC22021 TaxID=2861285 RepID=UPI001C63814B|nr:glycosyltransferase family 2 protein [Brevundimonas sp. PAMC22021]QYF87653.1 glycosyltransferase [Brevundimonas sp. PAMC22021]